MEKGTIYRCKATNVCYVCVFAERQFARLVDITGNSVSGNLREEDWAEATDGDILCDARVNFTSLVKKNKI